MTNQWVTRRHVGRAAGIVAAVAAGIGTVFALAAPPETLPTAGLKRALPAPSQSDKGEVKVVPKLLVRASASNGKLQTLKLGDRQVEAVSKLQNELMIALKGFSGDWPDVQISTQAELKMGEVLKIIEAAGGYRSRDGGFVWLLKTFYLSAPIRELDEVSGSPIVHRKFELLSIGGGS